MKFNRKIIPCLIAICIFSGLKLSAQNSDISNQSGTETKTIFSKILNENRKIRIQTPVGMNAFDAYPVLYVLDGEAQSVLVNGQVQYLSESYKIIPNLIVVAIENTDRTRDLTPTHSIIGPDGKPDTSVRAFGKNSGGGENFLRFIREELVPYVEGNYRTAPYRILAGHSLGGLIAIYCMVNHPADFNACIAISPSLQWDQEFMLRQVAKLNAKEITGKRILFFSDANEDSAFHRNQLVLDSLLKSKNISGLRFTRLFYPGESHISEPVKAFYDGIRFVYPSWHLPYNSSAFRKSMNSKIIRKHYDKLSKDYGYKVIPFHDEINSISRFLRNDSSRIKDAIELLEMNARNYPASSVIQETLGDTWLKSGNTANALTAYQKALDLDPSNEQIKAKIKKIKS